MFNVLAGGAVQRMAIFALGIMPYISASIIIQLMTTVFPELEALKKEGEAGRKILNQYTRYGTVALASIQAYGIAIGLEHWGRVVIDPGFFFRITAVITLVGGTILLMWIGEQITNRGIGNGISLIILAGIVARFPSLLGPRRWNRRAPARSTRSSCIAFLAFAVGAGGLHRIHGTGPAASLRQLSQAPGGQQNLWRRKLASSAQDQRLGRDPADFRVLYPPHADDDRELQCPESARLAADPRHLFEPRPTALSHPLCGTHHLLRVLLYLGRFQPQREETAENLKKYGVVFPGIRQGAKSAQFIDYLH